MLSPFLSNFISIRAMARINHSERESSPTTRRAFFGRASAAAILSAFLASGGRATVAAPADAAAGGGAVSLGSGDAAVLNYALALEQLEAEFYSIVLSRPYGGMSGGERQALSEIGAHEKAHVNFLRGALGGAAIPKLQFNFGQVNFADRQSVLTTARTFEDTGVAAYNGAGQFLKDPGHLLAAGKIVSVEARHAAVLRDLLNPRSTAFAGDDVVDSLGLGAVEKPANVLSAVRPFIVTPIDASGLPKS